MSNNHNKNTDHHQIAQQKKSTVKRHDTPLNRIASINRRSPDTVLGNLSRRWLPSGALVCLQAVFLQLIIFSISAPSAHAAAATIDSQIAQIRQNLNRNDAAASELESDLQRLDTNLQSTRQTIREERDNSYRSLHTARRDIARQKFELERIQQSINLLDQQIDLLKTDSDRSIARHESLNALKRSLEATEHTRRLQNNTNRMTALERDKQPLLKKLDDARQKVKALISQIPESSAPEVNVDDHPAMMKLLQQRAEKAAKLKQVRQQQRIQRATLAQAEEQKRAILARAQESRQKQPVTASARTDTTTVAANSVGNLVVFDPPPAAGIKANTKAHVFVISGKADPSIEQVLNLKAWVESYGARYYEAHWNGFGPTTSTDSTLFREQFAQYLRQIPASARIILIGHGLGGGAAIEAATQTAYSMGRTIDFLAVLDPIGLNNLRANIVYRNHPCQGFEAEDKRAVDAYINCVQQATPLAITSNVKHFYNRWQKEGRGPADGARSYSITLQNGEIRQSPTATGRFKLADNIQADQMRVFFSNTQDAHMALLQQESRNLPNLLVKHLR
ncbi:Hypothetical protein HDN1F_37810 [gamma proteobacterium HdN1]|nr:Hypothetical protein HDN1F_37810 [gamma proteobacterium HdN1]